MTLLKQYVKLNKHYLSALGHGSLQKFVFCNCRSWTRSLGVPSQSRYSMSLWTEALQGSDPSHSTFLWQTWRSFYSFLFSICFMTTYRSSTEQNSSTLKMQTPSHSGSPYCLCSLSGSRNIWTDLFHCTFPSLNIFTSLFIVHTSLFQSFWMISIYTGKYSVSFKKNFLFYLNERTCTVTFILHTAPSGIHLSLGRNSFDAVGSNSFCLLLKMLIIKRMCAMKKPCRYYLATTHLHCRWGNFKFLQN